MTLRFRCILLLATIFSLTNSEQCGYTRGPFAATNDTVVIKLDCNQSTPSSHDVPIELRNNATHVAVQLRHCHTVPVGLFTKVTDKLTSVTVASEDAVQLLGGTFEGLGQVTELRLLGFTRLKNLSTSMLEPLRNIQTLILDNFGGSNIELPYLGSVIRKLSGTPIRRLVINGIKGRLFFQQIMHVDDFKITNASVKELIITDVPFNYQGSIRLAFPELTCFCAAGNFDDQRAETYPSVFDLCLISDLLTEIVAYRPKDFPLLKPANKFNVPFEQFEETILKTAFLYPDLARYIVDIRIRFSSKDCALGFKFQFGANLSRITVNDILLSTKTDKPFCVEGNNNLIYVDLTGSGFPGTIPELIGFNKLQYLSLENTRIKTFSNTFLQHYPSLKVLKLSKLDLGDFLTNTKKNFFALCPTLAHINLDDCNLTTIPTRIFSQSINIQHLDVSRNYLRTLDFDLQNCTRLNVLNVSHNNIECITQKHMNHLNQLALQKPSGNDLVVDLSENKLHCLCNTTHFIKWLQGSLTESKIKFPSFDSYTCLYPNGSIVLVSEVIVSELEQQCSVIQTLVNGSDCPCDEKQRTRLEQVWVSLDGFFCKNGAGNLVAMKSQPLPICFNPYLRASFIAPVVIGGILGITVFITIGLLIYYRNSRRVRQVRDCLYINPLQYMMMHNHSSEEPASFRYDIMVFAQDDDQSRVHTHFIEALEGKRSFITQEDIRPGAIVLNELIERIRDCEWIIPVLTSKFLSDPVCMDFLSRVRVSRPHAVIPIVWEQPLAATDTSIANLLQTGEPLCWPGDLATPDDIRNFWSSLIERTISLRQAE